jgi:transcriptional regulator with XRE-family HTH domain
MKEIGLLIKNRRKEFGLTQPRLAVLSHVSCNTLVRIERGEENTTVGSLENVLNTLGLRLTAIINDSL